MIIAMFAMIVVLVAMCIFSAHRRDSVKFDFEFFKCIKFAFESKNDKNSGGNQSLQ